ncbi:MAG: alanine racemase [Cyanobacteria bacterium RYN_339]|nr:alanine racemase [Cyanobacteria bacterium RYN_339]
MIDHATLKAALAGRALPAAYVDLAAFDANVATTLLRAGDLPIRIATKSLRCVPLIQRVLAASPRFQGLMCYHPREALTLHAHGFDDLLVAYPVVQEAEIRAVAQAVAAGARITLMVDSPAHVERLTGSGIPLCLDVDMSARLPGLHFGVRRSPVTTVEQALAVLAAARAAGLVLEGVMGYEAQIAGVPDEAPGDPTNPVIRWLKSRSRRELAERRGAVVKALRDAGAELRFVNGGGTGSLESTAADPSVTEVTAGSAFYAPTLFDHYRAFKGRPAAGFALAVTRIPGPGLYTCYGGGYIASGAPGPAKLPSPYLPVGAQLLSHEGAGEVQTPIAYEGKLALGDPVGFRHAKAGELCERFDRLLLLLDGGVFDDVLTYRGEGFNFG